jgi:hypothetical protein
MSDKPSRSRLALPGWESTAGEASRTSKLTEGDILAIRRSKQSATKIASQYGITPEHVARIQTFKAWKSVKPEEP